MAAPASSMVPETNPRSILGRMVRHRTLANLLALVLILAGLFAAPQLRVQFFPDTPTDEVDVTIRWPGAGAEDVDRAIVAVLEPALLAVEGVTSGSARSSEGVASLELEFEPGWDMARAEDDVQAAIDAITTLPEDIEIPTTRASSWFDRVTDVVITGPVGIDQLARFTDEFVARLFDAGVTRSTIRGLAAPNIVVEVSMAQLIAHDLSVREIAEAIGAAVDADPAGNLGQTQSRVRTGIEARSADAIGAIVLRADANGTALLVRDVSAIHVEGVARERESFVGENPAMTVRVDRSEQGDALAIQAEVERVAEALMSELPPGVSIDLIRTRSDAIAGRLDILLDNGLVGLGLVLVLLFLFLNARTAFWVAAGLPTAMLAAVALMYVGGLTLNMISLFALIITLGIVVDDAIVVGEHADHLARQGMAPADAAEAAARRMAMPVIAATLTTIIAFMGLVIIGGTFGSLIADIPFTVIAVLTASLIECFLILPNHMAHALVHSAKTHWYDAPSRVVNRGFEWVREVLFRPLVAGAIAARYAVIAAIVLGLAVQAASFIRGDVTWRFFNGPERSSISGNFAMLPGATRDDALAQMRMLQEATEALGAEYAARYGANPLDYVIAEIGGSTGRGLAGTENTDADLLGGIAIELIGADERPYSAFAFLGELQERIERHPMAETVSFRGGRAGPGGDSLSVQFLGAEAETLKAAALDLRNALSVFPEVSALEDSLAYDREELILSLTPQGAALGFETGALGRMLRDRLGGVEAASYPVGPRSATVRVEMPTDALRADFLDTMMLRSPAGAYVPLSDIVRVETRTGFATVRRENGARLVTVSGDLSEDDPARAEMITAALEEQILPRIASEHQVGYRLSGLAEQESAFLSDARTGLILSLLGIYAVLAWVFASWSRPLVVMAVIPFGLVGTIYGHAIWDVPLSMFTVVGLLGMTGIIINDSIVLVTQIDRHAQTRGLIQAIVDGTVDRLRPVFLTTATTVLGLVPLLYEDSVDAEFLKPTVITLVYGLGFGMVLVLLLVPALIAVGHDVGLRLRALRRGARAGNSGLRWTMRASLVVLTGWFAATFGSVLMFGGLPGPLRLAQVATLAPETAALALFVGGAAVWALAVYTLFGLVVLLRRRVPV
jgi:multidrug efflux pump subunit AcrB